MFGGILKNVNCFDTIQTEPQPDFKYKDRKFKDNILQSKKHGVEVEWDIFFERCLR